jgi:hypothetical protein
MYCSRGRHFQPRPPHQTTPTVVPKSGLLHHGLLIVLRKVNGKWLMAAHEMVVRDQPL